MISPEARDSRAVPARRDGQAPAATSQEGTGDGDEAAGAIRAARMPRSLSLLIALANLALGSLLLGALVWLGKHVIHVLLLFTLGSFVAYALYPLVEALVNASRRRLPWTVGLFLVLASLALSIGLIVAAAVRPTTGQVRELEAKLPLYRARGQALAAQLDAWMAARHIPFRVAEGITRASDVVRSRSQALLTQSARALERVALGVVDLALVLLIAVYLLIFRKELGNRVARWASPEAMPYLQEFRRDLNQMLGGFIRGQLLLAVLYGVTAGLGCALLGLPFALLLGLFVAAMSLIPVVGPYIGALPAVLLALLDSPWKVLCVALLFLVINEVGSKVLYPRLVGHATGLHEVVVLFVLLAGAEAGGIWGALLAVPLTAFVGLVIVYGLRLWHAGVPLIAWPQLDATRSVPPGESRSHG
jgi:predicted PurR-regulated permease PerM